MRQSRSRLLCALAVLLAAFAPATATAASPAGEEYVLDVPGIAGSQRIDEVEVKGEVAGSEGIVGEGEVSIAGAIGDLLDSPLGLLMVVPAGLVGAIAIRSRTRR